MAASTPKRRKLPADSRLPPFDVYFQNDETDEPTGVPLSWGGAAGNYTEGDARFSRALIVHEGKPNQIRWLVRSAELMPYHAETLSQPMRTLRRQLWALQDAFKAVDHDFRNAESRLEQLNSLLLQANDPLELALGAGEDVFFDTALIHGHPQRVRIHQVLATVPPIVQECMAGVRALRRTHAAITAKRQEVAGAAIVRIARGRLGRLRAAERRYFLTMQAAAVAIQAAYWGYIARRYTVPRAIARRRHLAATAIQALARGHRTRLWFARVRQLEDFRVANQAAERIQAAWKGRLARARKHETFAAAAREKEEWAERRQARLVAARARREAKRQFAATTVQRIVRGFFARREAYMRRQQGYVAHPRARALANAFLAGGDVWGLLAAVSRDFERHDAERDQEQRQASAFVAQMVQLREGQEARDWDEWMASTAASLHAGESLWGGPEGATRSLEATRRSAVESLRLKSALILQGDASAPTQTGGDAGGGDGDSGAARDAGNGATTPRLAAGAGAGPAATPGGNTMAIVPFGPAAPGAEGGGPQGNGETSAASRGDAASLEDLLASRSMGRPPALSLLRDVRGMDGPYDALVLHAALRVVPIPSGVLTWCADNGVPLSRETAQAAEAAAARGSLMGAAAAPPHRRPGSRVRIAADFDRTGTGEEAARVFADLPPSLLKVRWENEARKIAAPAVAALHRQGVRCVRDVLTVDLEGSGIDPVLVGAIHRLVRVMAVAEQMVTPSAVRAKFASRAAPMPPPLFGPGRAAVGGAGTEAAVAGADRPFGAAAGAASGELAIRRGGARRRKPQRPGRAADRGSAHASGTGGRRRSRDSSDGSPHEREHEEEEDENEEEEEEEGSGIGAAGLGAPPEASSSTLPYWSAAAAGAPGSGLLAAKRPALRGRAGRKAAGAPAALFVTRSSAAGAPVAVPVHGIAGQGGAEERKAGDGAAMTRWGAGRTGAAASVIYAETGLFGQYGEATEYAAEDDRGDAAMRAKARSGATLLTPSNPSGTVPAAYTRAGRASAAAAAAGAGKAAPHGARAGPQSRGRGASSFGADRDQTGTRLGADEIELPAGFEVLERDEALTAQGIRRAAQDHSRRDRRRVELAAERGKARAIAAEATQRALAALRRGDTAAGVSSSGSGDRGGNAPSVGQALAEASRLVGTSATPMAGEPISAGEIEGTMVSMLNRLHASVNTLSAVDSLEAPVDPACLQAALRMPLPMPTLTQMVDYRAGRNRSEAERAKVVVPYDLFLRQVVAYEAAAAAGVLARAGGAGSRLPSGDEAADHAARVAEAEAAAAQKQRMLVRERLAVAEAMARPWVRALGRGGFTRIGQLVKMPRLELERSLASAYPIKPEGGVTLAGRRAQEVAGGIPPHKAAAAVEAALEHWIATRPDIADAVYLRVTSFDPRFQRSAADSRGAGPGARAFGDLAAQRRPLASADWRTFQRQRYNIGSATGNSSRAGARGGGASRRGAPEQPGSAVDALD
ncbi:hypothetical protein FNF27_01439 [Cafeteria roenbergensis]|uniref:Uncharacterized protein n=2 Tax=Cafeteria roenbergensis TaxID=33653 RepID=A0A5A8EHP0_CAFRO|nr:hypothetical protein FNF27_01439 [Cafeteria roenbergensis]